MREFVNSCIRKGVQPAVYYSLNHNWYLNAASSVVQPGPLKPGQVSVTQKQYEAIALAQYTALTLTGAFFSRYALLVNPINYMLCSVNVALFSSSAWHLGRKVKADYVD